MSFLNTAAYYCTVNFSPAKKTFLQLKHLIFFLLFLKFCLQKKQGVSFSFFLRPLRKNIITIYKAPYRFKLSKHQFFFPRFGLVFKFCFNFFFKFKELQALSAFIFFFSSIGFCFYTAKFSKISVVFFFKEWLK